MILVVGGRLSAAGPEPEASVASPTPSSPMLLITESGGAAAVTSVISIGRISGLRTRPNIQAQSSYKSTRFGACARTDSS